MLLCYGVVRCASEHGMCLRYVIERTLSLSVFYIYIYTYIYIHIHIYIYTYIYIHIYIAVDNIPAYRVGTEYSHKAHPKNNSAQQ